jgi:chemotaxis protein CheX
MSQLLQSEATSITATPVNGHAKCDEHEEDGGHTCPSCGSLWVRMGRKPKAAPTHIYPEGGWLPLIRSSIQEVFEIMLGSETGPGVNHGPGVSADITAMVGLAGELQGMMSIRCTSAAACGMASAMLGTTITQLDNDVQDALGEVCNMVAGNFKAKIPGLAQGCSLSVPTVITGADYRLHPLADGEQVIVSFTFHDEPVWVALDLHG